MMWCFEHNKRRFSIKTASKAEIDELSSMINDAYSMWSFLGRKLHTAVTSKLMRKGLGREIFEEVVKFGKENGYHGILLWTGKDTGWLLEWYLRLGFEVIGEGILYSTDIKTVMMLKMF